MEKHGMWTVLDTSTRHWFCRCDCGTERAVSRSDVLSGKSKGCGCSRAAAMKEAQRKAVTRHGLADTPTHRSWIEMRRRCYATHRKEYANYGGRGITVCDRWKDSFDAFLADMGERPPGHTIDRIDNDGPYAPGNCRWLARAKQEMNKRNNLWLQFGGERLSVREASKKFGIREMTLRNRINTLGWSVERALTEPVRHLRPRAD